MTRQKSVDFQFVVEKLSREDSSFFFVGVLNKNKTIISLAFVRIFYLR